MLLRISSFTLNKLLRRDFPYIYSTLLQIILFKPPSGKNLIPKRSFITFWETILESIRPAKGSILNTRDSVGVKLVAGISVGSWTTNLGKLKNGKHHLQENNKSDYIAVLSNSWKGLELVSNLYNIAKNTRKVTVISFTNIWLNFILILPRTLKKQWKEQVLISMNVYDDVTDFEVSGFTKNVKI